MKKNKKSIIITLLIAILIFSTAAICEECAYKFNHPESENSTNSTTNTQANVNKDTTTTNILKPEETSNNTTTAAAESQETFSNSDVTTSETTSNLIHGVEPTKVTVHATDNNEDGKFNVYLEFYNVGQLGGDEYAKAILNETLIEKGEHVQGAENDTVWVWEGTFSGGPNGDFNLKITNMQGTNATTHFKLKDGKDLVTDDGGSFPIDNPEAFDGWKD